MTNTILISTLVIFAAGSVSFAAKKAKEDSVITSMAGVKFMPMDPKNPEGIQIGSANGDVMNGAGVFYMKLKQGAAPMHSHTNSYHGVNVKGVVKHWVTGDEKSAPEMAVGSYWFQPGGQAHGDMCVSVDGCIVLLNFMGKFDFVPAKK